LASGAAEHGVPFYIIGDVPSPVDFHLDGCSFYSLAEQRRLGFQLAQLCPERHYARKNLGYLLAMRNGAEVLIETDDDNLPRTEFWAERELFHLAPALDRRGWVNVYAWYTDALIWPRGYPLDLIRKPHWDGLPEPTRIQAPIQQGLADDNPDVDAIYRLVEKLPVRFERNLEIALGRGSWCPFNSQNTTWFREAFPLLYLPSHCSFRMTDIWRSFVAQRIAWENNWTVLFHGATVEQARNEHSLMRDFRDEIPGYLNNAAIAEALEALSLRSGVEHLAENLFSCYEQFVRLGLVDPAELRLLRAWVEDCQDTSA